jgi:glutathione S-transferase
MSSPAKIPAKSPLRSKSKSKSGSPSKKVNAPIKTASGTSVPAAPMPIPSSEHRLKARETTKDWKVQIYHGMDPLSQKLLLYTTIKKIPGVELKSIDRKANEHLTREMKELSPHGRLPVMRVSSSPEAAPIVMHGVHSAILFCEHYYMHLTPMLPPLSDPAAVAEVLECLSEADELVSILRSWKEFKVVTSEPPEESTTAPASKQEIRFLAALKQDLVFLLRGFESRITENAAAPKHNFIIGSSATVADIALVPHLMWMTRRGADLSINFPILSAYLAHAGKCEQVAETYKSLPDYMNKSTNKQRWVMSFLNLPLDSSGGQGNSAGNGGGGGVA